jgi:hypothetical protein
MNHLQTFESDGGQAKARTTSVTVGPGHLREPLGRMPTASLFLFAEAFPAGNARIASEALRQRLPRALEIVERRERELHGSSDGEVEAAKDDFRALVAQCEAHEKETGEPMLFISSLLIARR